MTEKTVVFAGGGTGGHLYPALAVAERLSEIAPETTIHFFCSERPIDGQILSKASFAFTPLPAQGLTLRPHELLKGVQFFKTFRSSYRQVRAFLGDAKQPVVVGVGGFVAGPVCYAAHRARTPLALINVDCVPGKVNKLARRWAHEVFTQFDDTTDIFSGYRAQVRVVGCPIRQAFDEPDPQRARDELKLDPRKKVLLVTGASSGCRSINEALQALLPKFDPFAESWQIVHVTGSAHFEAVKAAYHPTKIAYKAINYYEHMPDLLSCAQLLIGRSGAVSVAEYAAAGVPSICIPYPHHRDRHQYLNAEKLVCAGAAIMVDDLPDLNERTAWLWEELEALLSDERRRMDMSKACDKIAKKDAAAEIARRLLEMQ